MAGLPSGKPMEEEEGQAKNADPDKIPTEEEQYENFYENLETFLNQGNTDSDNQVSVPSLDDKPMEEEVQADNADPAKNHPQENTELKNPTGSDVVVQSSSSYRQRPDSLKRKMPNSGEGPSRNKKPAASKEVNRPWLDQKWYKPNLINSTSYHKNQLPVPGVPQAKLDAYMQSVTLPPWPQRQTQPQQETLYQQQLNPSGAAPIMSQQQNFMRNQMSFAPNQERPMGYQPQQHNMAPETIHQNRMMYNQQLQHFMNMAPSGRPGSSVLDQNYYNHQQQHFDFPPDMTHQASSSNAIPLPELNQQGMSMMHQHHNFMRPRTNELNQAYPNAAAPMGTAPMNLIRPETQAPMMYQQQNQPTQSRRYNAGPSSHQGQNPQQRPRPETYQQNQPYPNAAAPMGTDPNQAPMRPEANQQQGGRGRAQQPSNQQGGRGRGRGRGRGC